MGPEHSERERERASDAVASGDEVRAVGRASGRLAACCGKSRAGRGAKLGHARCSCGQATRTGRQSRPAWEKEKEKGLGWFGWAKMEEDEFFKVKSFSKSISSISQI